MTGFWRRFLTAQMKTHVFQYLGSPLEDQALRLESHIVPAATA
jgi:hypothetical protein